MNSSASYRRVVKLPFEEAPVESKKRGFRARLNDDAMCWYLALDSPIQADDDTQNVCPFCDELDK